MEVESAYMRKGSQDQDPCVARHFSVYTELFMSREEKDTKTPQLAIFLEFISFLHPSECVWVAPYTGEKVKTRLLTFFSFVSNLLLGHTYLFYFDMERVL